MDELKQLAKQIAQLDTRRNKLAQQRDQTMIQYLQAGHPKVSVAKAAGVTRQRLDAILKGNQ